MGSRSHLEPRVHGVTRNPGSRIHPDDSGHLEDSGHAESSGNPGSRSRPEFWVAGVTWKLGSWRHTECGYPEPSVKHIPGVTRNQHFRSHP